jgi:hypothetical protein
MIIHVARKQTTSTKKERMIMYMNMTAEQINYMFEANANIGNAIIRAFKKYWAENAEIICAGLAAMSGQYYVPSSRK